jgi:hypothetical protein
MSSPGCAQGQDGKLLDASIIHWYNDPDDVNPILPTLPTSSASNSSPPTTLDHFVHRALPAEKIAGVRQTTRVSRPSARMTNRSNPDNIMAPTHFTYKRRASSTDSTEAPARRRARRSIPDSDGEDPTNTDSVKDGEDDVIKAFEDGSTVGGEEGMPQETVTIEDADRGVSEPYAMFLVTLNCCRALDPVLKMNALQIFMLSSIKLTIKSIWKLESWGAAMFVLFASKYIHFFVTHTDHSY